jgi:hypothetical protein
MLYGLNNVGLPGSATGQRDETQAVFYSHGANNWGVPTLHNCDFEGLAIEGSVNGSTMQIAGCVIGSAFAITDSHFDRCEVTHRGIGTLNDDSLLSVTRTVYRPVDSCSNSQASCRQAGDVVFDHCTVDLSLIDDADNSTIFNAPGGAAGATDLTFKNSILIQKGVDYRSMAFGDFHGDRDTLSVEHTMILNPSAGGGNLEWLMVGAIGYTGLQQSQLLDLSGMKANDLADAATTIVNGAVIAEHLDADYRPVVRTIVRSATGGDVGAFAFSSQDTASEIGLGLLLI